MRANVLRSCRVLLLAIVGMGVNGCPPDTAIPGKVTGGGTIPSTSGVSGNKANLGFIGDGCDPDNVAGSFNYHDKNAPGFQPGGVKVLGAVVEAGECALPNGDTTGNQACGLCGDSATHGITALYRSTNPKQPGTGTVIACLTDNGEGANAGAPDAGIIEVLSGPFAAYFNAGAVQGNVQVHSCE